MYAVLKEWNNAEKIEILQIPKGKSLEEETVPFMATFLWLMKYN